MEPNLSPGPWATYADCGDEAVLDADGFMVADCAIFSLRKGFRKRGGDNRANARAIALVPHLIEYVRGSADNGCATARALIARLRDSGRLPKGEDERSSAECEASQSGGEAASPETSLPKQDNNNA